MLYVTPDTKEMTSIQTCVSGMKTHLRDAEIIRLIFIHTSK